MSDLALRIVGLGKQYRIGGKQERYRTLRDALTDALVAPVRRARALLRGQAYGAAGLDEIIWALRDISFEVKHGEVVGIIGRNGAGKSTLLKVLSRITEPSEGYAEIYGRVGSLLEVGTGFHPELTGRENVYLNGAILGMSRQEIDRKFDEIVAFAEVEKFIDTPVKHYSSGMGLRLGFAVAAHLEPEILVVDEVLAVGDAQFQKKCMGKMSDVAGEGRTVLFVSHNMASIHALCPRSILLDQGQIVTMGETETVVGQYLTRGDTYTPVTDLTQEASRRPGASPLLTSLKVSDRAGNPRNSFNIDEAIRLELGLASEQRINQPSVGIGINNWLGQRILTVSTRLQGLQFPDLQHTAQVICELPPLMLAPGKYTLKITAGSLATDIDIIEQVNGFEIVPSDIYGTGKLPNQKQGMMFTIPTWEYANNQ